MPAVIDFKVLGEKQISRSLERWSTRMLDASPAFQTILERMRNQTEEQFSSEGGRGSGGWSALKPETIEFKRRHGYPLDILHRTLDLKYSLIAKGNPEGGVAEVTPLSVKYGTDIPYAIFHQSGTSKMPRRRVIEFTENDRREYVKILQLHIVQQDRGVL